MTESVSSKSEIARLIPDLHRFARAVAGDRDLGGASAVVQKAVGAETGGPEGLRGRLYAELIRLNRLEEATGASAPMGASRDGDAAAGFAGLPLPMREALALVVIEGFRYAEAATLLGVSRDEVSRLILDARRELARRIYDPEAAASGSAGRRTPYLRIVK